MSNQVRPRPRKLVEESEIRVAFCENGAGYGGAVISLEAFLEHAPRRLRPYIYTGLDTPNYQSLSRFGQWRHMPPISYVKQGLLRRFDPKIASALDNVFNLAPLVLQFYRAFRADRIELVYLNNDPSCNLAMAMAARLAGLPCILHARGFSANTKGTRWVLSNITHCIAVSQAVKSQLSELDYSGESCTVVPEGLDFDVFYPRTPSNRLRQELGFDGTEPVITLVGGLIDWKGQDILLAACPAVLQAFPDAQILLVGSAYGRDDSYATMINKMASSPELLGKVRLLGARNDVPEILSVSTIVLHTSTKPEPFGRTFLEGMAMGKAVIASNEGGPAEVIEHEKDGLLITPRNPSELASAIIRLLADPGFAATLAKSAERKAAVYSIENHARAIMEAIDKTINSR